MFFESLFLTITAANVTSTGIVVGGIIYALYQLFKYVIIPFSVLYFALKLIINFLRKRRPTKSNDNEITTGEIVVSSICGFIILASIIAAIIYL